MANRLKELREKAGFTQDEAATRFGMSRSGYIKIEDPARDLKSGHIAKAKEIYGVSADDIIGLRQLVPVMGYAGAGARIFPFEDGPLDEVDPPPGAPMGTEAVIVRGDSMYPLYRDGDILFFIPTDQAPNDLIGKECLVTLATGEMMVKVLRRGSSIGLWTLESYNAPPIEDVALTAIIPVKWVERR